MFDETQRLIDLGQYRPSMDEATANCRASLNWLQESEKELLLLETGKGAAADAFTTNGNATNGGFVR